MSRQSSLAADELKRGLVEEPVGGTQRADGQLQLYHIVKIKANLRRSHGRSQDKSVERKMRAALPWLERVTVMRAENLGIQHVMTQKCIGHLLEVRQPAPAIRLPSL